MATNGDYPHPEKRVKVMSQLESFDCVFPELVNLLTKKGLVNPQISEATAWFKEVSEYNVPYGKKNRGLTVVTSYQQLVPDASEEDIHLARVLGWCIEWLQAFFLVADDIMDESVTRRGKPCWYKKDAVGMIAINDAFYLESCVYEILRSYFRGKPYYADIVDLFHLTTMKTVTGQCLDLITAPVNSGVDFTKFTEERYDAIVQWKTAYYSFYLPVALAMCMAGRTDVDDLDKAQSILLIMGRYFQIQDDFLDCFGDPSVTGKVGTDIEDNKCSWLVIQALQKATPEQRHILQENYGQKDPEKVNKVKQLYRDLQLEKLFEEFEEKSYKDVISLIEKNSGNLPVAMFIEFANKIYKRKK
ncbi:hypothetical protein FSP39_018879 [Pinctada imbricata]|uniref:Farnesyl pyrophosphate synthase n=1 Tax=Pinctada imbricata TaxID=66713 RepID=A0AA88YRW1_PINIB|nr:hypothetical protein FSP39_018879 [Pinctada imbricata]